MQTPNSHATPSWALSLLPFISCAVPLCGEWHGNSSHIHALLLIISIGIVLLFYAQKKIHVRDILEGVRWFPTVGLLLILLAQGMNIENGGWRIEDFGHPWQGMFDNPAGLACFACCLLTIESGNRAEGKRGQWWHWTVMAMLAVIVLLTHSRTGVMALVLLAGIRLWHVKKLRWGIGMVVILSLFGLLHVKHDSTSGRRFILQNTWQMICERPLTGWGWHGFDRYYMQVQAEYFKQHPEDTANAWLADDVRHPMNEFLLWWIRFGIAWPVALGGLLLWPAMKKTDSPPTPLSCKEGELAPPLRGVDVSRETSPSIQERGRPGRAGGESVGSESLLCTLLLFACLSYPLHYAFSWLFIGLAWMLVYKRRDERASFHISTLCSLLSTLFIAFGTVSLFLSVSLMQAEGAAEQHAHHRALRIYRQLAPVCQWNPHFLYSYARELYVTGQFIEALEYVNRCEDYWCRYDLTLLKGDIYRQLQQYAEAEATYHTAHYMCPNRFAPLEGLLAVYEAKSDSVAALATAQTILNRPVKVQSGAVAEIRQMAKLYLQKHNKPQSLTFK